MKLQKLIIQNIASIEYAELDFENGPLGQDPIFLICGPTGAGKSTILDAICLALYNTTPRLLQSANERFLDNDFTGQSEEVGIGDPRMLMRRDSTMASSQLWFTDANDESLMAEWSVARARGNRSGKIQRVSWTLSKQDGTPLTMRLSDTRQEIVNRLGLTFEQFCRTALLAQGEFTRFLKSREEEKSDILEKLTGTGIYSQVSMEIYAVKGEKEDELKRLESKVEGILLLSDEQLAGLQKESDELDAALVEERKIMDQLSGKKKWMDDFTMWKDRVSVAKEAYAAAQSKVESEKYIGHKKCVADWDTTVDARSCLALRKEWITSRNAVSVALEKLKAEYVRLLGGECSLQKRVEDTQLILSQTEVFLRNEKLFEEMYRQAQTIISLQGQICRSARLEADYQSQKKRRIEVRGKQKEAFQKKSEAYAQALADEKAKQEEIDACDVQLETMAVNRLKVMKEQSEQRLQNIERMNDALVRQKEKKTLYEEAMKNLENLETDCQKLEKAHVTLSKKLETARKEAEETQLVYDRQKMSCEDWAKEARICLSIGDICPVCGQKLIKMPPTDEEYISLLQPVRDLLDKKIIQLDKCVEAVRQNEADLKSHLKLKMLAEKARMMAEIAWEQSCKALVACAVYQEVKDEPDIDEAIARLELAEKMTYSKLQERWDKADALQQKRVRLQKEKDTLAIVTESIRTGRDETEKEIVGTDAAIRNLENAIEREHTAMEEAEKRILPMLASDGWKRLWRENVEEFMQKLQTAAGKYAEAESLCVHLQQQLNNLEKERSGVDEAHRFILQMEVEWADLLPREQVKMENLLGLWNTLCTSVASEKRTFLQAESKILEADKALSDFLANHPEFHLDDLEKLSEILPETVMDMREKIRRIDEALIACQTDMKRLEEELAKHVQKRPELPEGTTISSLQNELMSHETTVSAKIQRRGAILQMLQNHAENAERMKSLREQIDAKQKEVANWKNLSALFGSADGKKFRNIAQSYVLRQLLTGANHYLSRLTDRYRMECQPGSLTILLRDEYQGGISRPTSTISGGESFLVSLSLALGLSLLSRRSLAVDTLFIDEGFGTLDGDYLNTVMDALERLHQMGGRKVGIISHVESLKERIRTQIHVAKINNTLSRIEVTTSC